MKPVYTASFILIFLLISSCAGTKTFTTPSPENSLTIDGNISDWSTGISLIEQSESINYYASADDEFLYLFVDVKSPFFDNAIKQSGLIIYLNNSEEMRKQVGIAFPAGSFNLLRDRPGAYENFIDEMDWFENPSNRELLSDLAEENFSRAMIVERADGKSNPVYGFVDLSQLEVDGLEMAYNEQSRYTAIELKIPLSTASLFDLNRENIWLGFAVEPPEFNIREQAYDVSNNRNRQSGYGGSTRNRQPTAADQRRILSRNLGEFSTWYKLEVD